MAEERPIALIGATGFVGSRLHAALRREGRPVVGTTRNPEGALQRYPDRRFRRLDLQDPDSMASALEGCRAAVYLVHAMGGSRDYAVVEERGAVHFRQAAAAAGLERIVYLGGVQPVAGKPSAHLRSRLRTGAALRAGSVPAIELRASMIIGGGSASFRMVRDLSARLPLMVLPRWSRSRSEPVGIHDVVFALSAALDLPAPPGAVYSLPGPEVLTAREILMRTAHLMGRHPRAIGVPLLSPRLSAYWIRLVTRAHPDISRELVEGLRNDLICHAPRLWDVLGHTPQGFDDAVRAALEEEQMGLSLGARALEHAVGQSFARRPKP